MAVRFRCKRCHQMLGIASRKAGSRIECPKCGLPQVVPGEEAAAAAMAMDELAPSHQPVAETADVVVYDDQPATIETPRQVQPSEEIAEAAEPTVASQMILYPRKSLYLQAVLMLLLAVGAFACGYAIGRGDAAYRREIVREEEARESVLVDGKLVYNPGTGQIAGDADAVVIALPAEKWPEKGFSVKGIRPQDPTPAESHKGVRRIIEFGGAYARAKESGNFDFLLPDQGSYRLLVISRHASRERGSDLDEVDLGEIQEYFPLAEQLIGRSKYRWSTEQIASGLKSVEIDFGRDGEP